MLLSLPVLRWRCESLWTPLFSHLVKFGINFLETLFNSLGQFFIHFLIDALDILIQIAANRVEQIVLYLIRLFDDKVNILIVVHAHDATDRFLPTVLILQLQLIMLNLLQSQIDVALDLTQVRHEQKFTFRKLSLWVLAVIVEFIINQTVQHRFQFLAL